MEATWSRDQTFSESNQPGEANSHGQLPRLIKYILLVKQNHLVKNIYPARCSHMGTQLVSAKAKWDL